MTGSRWHQVTDIFHRALERDAPSREAFLAGACAADPSLRADVEALLAAHEQAGSFGETPFVTSIAHQLAAGTELGPYRIDALIGAGGMGEVYRARDTRLHRDVALKVLRPPLAGDPARLARFVQEARAASALEHPHIAVVHDFGNAAGITYIVMELVRGESLKELGSDAVVEIVPGKDHSNLLTPEIRARIRKEMTAAFLKHHPRRVER